MDIRIKFYNYCGSPFQVWKIKIIPLSAILNCTPTTLENSHLHPTPGRSPLHGKSLSKEPSGRASCLGKEGPRASQRRRIGSGSESTDRERLGRPSLFCCSRSLFASFSRDMANPESSVEPPKGNNTQSMRV